MSTVIIVSTVDDFLTYITVNGCRYGCAASMFTGPL
jgi:hypothetical protein